VRASVSSSANADRFGNFQTLLAQVSRVFCIMPNEWKNEGFLISTDPAKLDAGAVHTYLTRSYWAEGISRELVERSLRRSLCFGLFKEDRQIGLARVISDYSTFAYLADVYVLEEYRSQGLGKWLIRCVMEHPDLQGLRRFVLVTRDAHELYRPFGFAPPKKPGNFMEWRQPAICKTDATEGQSVTGRQLHGNKNENE
jgi:N-acetylglutamate synthase-like GNAT family acetyltransferase